MQSHPPVYRRATPEELAFALPEDFEPETERKGQRTRPKRKRQPTTEVFDVKRWRLSARWRNDKRVGDAAIAKMTKGCEPERLELLAKGEL